MTYISLSDIYAAASVWRGMGLRGAERRVNYSVLLNAVCKVRPQSWGSHRKEYTMKKWIGVVLSLMLIALAVEAGCGSDACGSATKKADKAACSLKARSCDVEAACEVKADKCCGSCQADKAACAVKAACAEKSDEACDKKTDCSEKCADACEKKWWNPLSWFK